MSDVLCTLFLNTNQNGCTENIVSQGRSTRRSPIKVLFASSQETKII